MFPKINNKSIMKCMENDFEELLHNNDYRENQYLEYKKDFAFRSVSNDKKANKIMEFRNDICAFANADGGYIIYGIGDEQGTASELIGVDIENPDKFELELRNKLTPILPQIPPVQFRFVKLISNRYLVVIRIEHDFHAPYLHIEEQKKYFIYKRDGNQKRIIGYTELKSMFVQSRVLDDEILEFRRKRISYFSGLYDDVYERFMIFHFMPECFLTDRKQLFVIERQRNINFGAVFSGTKIDSLSLPCVDGLRYVTTTGAEEGILYNNGIAEFVLPLDGFVDSNGEEDFFSEEDVWNYVDNVVQGYQAIMPTVFGNQRYFGCVSIIGCRNMVSEDNGYDRTPTRIDRNMIICQPISFTSISDKDVFYFEMKKLHLEFLLSLGIRRSRKVFELIGKITEEEDMF